jgi:hypothetical protein
MSIASDVIRPFWLRDLNNVSGIVTKDLAYWFNDKDYQVYDPLQPNLFILFASSEQPLLSAFAYDTSRMTLAACYRNLRHGYSLRATMQLSSPRMQLFAC